MANHLKKGIPGTRNEIQAHINTAREHMDSTGFNQSLLVPDRRDRELFEKLYWMSISDAITKDSLGYTYQLLSDLEHDLLKPRGLLSGLSGCTRSEHLLAIDHLWSAFAWAEQLRKSLRKAKNAQ